MFLREFLSALTYANTPICWDFDQFWSAEGGERIGAGTSRMESRF